MRCKINPICFVVFLTSTLVCAADETFSKQQVDAESSSKFSASNTTVSTNSITVNNALEETMQAEASKSTMYIEGGPAKIQPADVKPLDSSANSDNAKSTNGSVSTITSVVDTVLSPLNAREHMPPNINSSTSNSEVKSAVDNLEASTNDEHRKQRVMPRKGVEITPSSTSNVNVTESTLLFGHSSNVSSTNSTTAFATSSSTTVTTTTTTITPKSKPKKPLFTIGSDDEPYAPSHFVSSKKNESNKTISKVPTWESYEYSKDKSASSDYIVPIVGVILSVPLVSILLNFIYKRTKEWWHHRHYRRMDFLIDGMYNN